MPIYVLENINTDHFLDYTGEFDTNDINQSMIFYTKQAAEKYKTEHLMFEKFVARYMLSIKKI